MTLRLATSERIGAILDGKISDDEAMRYLTELDELALNAEHIAGAVDAVMHRAEKFPEFPGAMDVCGTGGDYQHSYNISTAAALVVAACGVKVAKHGNKAITSRSGSADVLEALGVRTSLSVENSAKVLNEVGISFLFAPTFHPGFARIAPLRKTIGHRTIFNLLGPLCNPARVDYQLIGVYHPALCAPMAGAANLLGRKHVMVVHGEEGSDEISISGKTKVSELVNNVVTHYDLEPRRAGLPTRPADELKGGDAEENAAAMLEILDGAENTYADSVVFNAGVALYIAGKAPALRGGATMAREALAKGEAKRVLNHLIEVTQTTL